MHITFTADDGTVTEFAPVMEAPAPADPPADAPAA